MNKSEVKKFHVYYTLYVSSCICNKKLNCIQKICSLISIYEYFYLKFTHNTLYIISPYSIILVIFSSYPHCMRISGVLQLI